MYEYRCNKCSKTKEVLQRYDDPAPKCCEAKMKRLISPTSFALKGGGWYKDGYMKPNGKDK